MTDFPSEVRLCVVCAGNICRSPIAEVVLRQQLDEVGLSNQVAVESAGTGDWHAGDPADRRARSVLQQHGYDGSAHRARQFRTEWFDSFDLVLALDRDNFADLHRLATSDAARAKLQMLRGYDADAVASGDLDVPDPYLGDAASFELVLAMVERAAVGVVDTVRRELAATADAEGGEHRRH